MPYWENTYVPYWEIYICAVLGKYICAVLGHIHMCRIGTYTYVLGLLQYIYLDCVYGHPKQLQD